VLKPERKRERAAGGIVTGVKLDIEEKRREKGVEEECMERNVHIGNEWWKMSNNSIDIARRCGQQQDGSRTQ
jgi:hypothetical protein